MIEKYEKLVNLLISKEKKISTMESCTGGAIANMLTSIPNASKIMMFSAVTYANEYKIKMGVPEEVITKYTVYSKETACAMAKAISDYTRSNYGVGVTGKLKKVDENNPYGADDVVYLAIYNRDDNNYATYEIKLQKEGRIKNKEEILNYFVDKMLILCK